MHSLSPGKHYCSDGCQSCRTSASHHPPITTNKSTIFDGIMGQSRHKSHSNRSSSIEHTWNISMWKIVPCSNCRPYLHEGSSQGSWRSISHTYYEGDMTGTVHIGPALKRTEGIKQTTEEKWWDQESTYKCLLERSDGSLMKRRSGPLRVTEFD